MAETIKRCLNGFRLEIPFCKSIPKRIGKMTIILQILAVVVKEEKQRTWTGKPRNQAINFGLEFNFGNDFADSKVIILFDTPSASSSWGNNCHRKTSL